MQSIDEKPLFIPLNAKFYRQFESGEKSVEYRLYGARWNERNCRIGRKVTLSLGYGKHERLSGEIKSFERNAEVTKREDWIECYGSSSPDAVAACIGIEVIRE